MLRKVHLLTVVLLGTAISCGGDKSSGNGEAATASGTGSATASETESQLGPFGPPMGVKADVVRSLALSIHGGGVEGEFTGKKGDGTTGVRGLCNPDTFANFSFELPVDGYDWVEAAIMSKKAVGTGATGEFRLDFVWVTFLEEDMTSHDFKGPGTMTITRHDAASGARRMIGTIVGKGLKGRDAEEGKTADVTISFDMDYSCGVT